MLHVKFNFVANVPSQSCSCAFSVLISLHTIPIFKMFFYYYLFIMNILSPVNGMGELHHQLYNLMYEYIYNNT